MRKILVIGIIILLICVSISSSVAINNIKKQFNPISSGNTLYVGGSGPGNYTKIQYAINDASDGDTVFVFNGTYYENIVVNKSINLIGECRNTTFIFDWDWDSTVDIVANWVNFSGFTIKWSYYIGIKISSDYNTISNINISDSDGYGIYFSNTANNNYIIRNIFSEIGYDYYYSSIYLDSTHSNLIMDNTILNNFLGIRIYSSNNNIIENNNFSGNANCISLFLSDENSINNNSYIDNAHGIMLRNSSKNIIIGNYLDPYVGCTSFYLSSSSNNNIVLNNTIFGGSNLRIYKSNNNTVKGNTIADSHSGIDLVNSSNNTIICNTLISNYFSGISCIPGYEKDNKKILLDKECKHVHKNKININQSKMYNSNFGNNNTIYHNNIINNEEKNAYDICNNTWDDGYPSGGNFWDDYTGEDADGDGIGDTPYFILGGDNIDRYPLMKPLGGNLPPIAIDDYFMILKNSEDNLFDILANDYDLEDDDITIELVSDPRYGNLTDHGDYLTYTPDPDYVGDDYFYYVINDGHNGKSRAWVDIKIFNNSDSPIIPKPPTGPIKGKHDENYTYYSVTTDPDGDNISYLFDWGDETTSGWSDFIQSGRAVNATHSWKKGNYLIKVKAKDIFGLESDWSEPLKVTIPRTKSSFHKWYEYLLYSFPILEKLLEFFR